MIDDDIELIHSPLTRTHSAEGHTLQIHIYRGAGSPWILEVVDELGTSTVWDVPFDTDTVALEAALLAIEEEGIHSFVTTAQKEAKAAEPEFLRKLAEARREPSTTSASPDMMAPLSDEELDELDDFLLDLDAEEAMTLDMLDGFLHALAIGPETVMPSRWLPRVWGLEDGGLLPPVADMEVANHLLGLVMRHFNSIVLGFEQHPPEVSPMWTTTRYDTGEFEDAEMWAYGFTEAVQLSPAAWQALFKHPDGQRWYRPIHLLGADDAVYDEEALTRTPEQREALARQIEASLREIHAFWVPLRQAVTERRSAQAMSTKVGRNEPCPCGSGKKFKKCCGAPSELH
jgi:uncharacterized protein